ncbi:LPXTG cell wall anchor domain-containing protein [Enterococcus faecalis]|nr:LPXTG cell wall anchor domain-containing protein [Enterococcus faecalis]
MKYMIIFIWLCCIGFSILTLTNQEVFASKVESNATITFYQPTNNSSNKVEEVRDDKDKKNILPQTGEKKSGTFWLGIVSLIIVFFELIRRWIEKGGQNEEEIIYRD